MRWRFISSQLIAASATPARRRQKSCQTGFSRWRIRTPSATGYYEVAAQARPMMMLAETCIIGGTMDGYGHLGIAELEDIMVRWKGHEGSAR